MKPRQFNAALKSVSTRGKIDPAKTAKLTDLEKQQMMAFIVRYRKPVITLLVPGSLQGQTGYTPESWLHAMGYLQKKSNGAYEFWVTSENEHEVA